MLLLLENLKQCIENGLDGINVQLGYENVNAHFPVESVCVFITAAAIRSGEQDIEIYVDSPDEDGSTGCLRKALDVVMTLAQGGFDMTGAVISGSSYNRNVQGFEVKVSFKVKTSDGDDCFFGAQGRIVYAGNYGSVSYSFNAESAVIELEQDFYPVKAVFDSKAHDMLRSSSRFKISLNGMDITAVTLILMSEPVDIELNVNGGHIYKNCVLKKYVCEKNSYDIVLSCEREV